jgi:nitrogen-specific signal transduction histidine kinase
LSDITERKRADQEKEKLRSQFLQAQKMESVGRLAGGVAHDFNNMLQAILGHSEMASMTLEEDHPVQRHVKQIQNAAQRSAAVVSQLLAFARKQAVSPRALDLNDTVPAMLKMLRRLIGEDIDLAWMPGHQLRKVMIDPSQVDQILVNLAVNARDAIAGVGKIVIETRNMMLDEAYCAEHPECVPGEYVQLAVGDNGAGMSKEVLDQLFEPFFTTKEPGKGTGLGLSTIYGIVKQNNGCIEVQSEPGKGSSFKVYLPALGLEAHKERERGEPQSFQGGTETILLVEDEETIRDATHALLERLGYRVLSAKTPNGALRLVDEHSGDIDLLITDVVMPEMNGLELAERISGLRPGIKSLFISGYTADVIAHHGVLDMGANFIQKPFSLMALAVKVREALDKV